MNTLKIGFIGSGNMAQALAKGLIAAGVTKPNNVMASSPVQDEKLLKQFQTMGCNITHHNDEAAAFSDVLILAVKPNVMTHVLKDISPKVSSETPLIASVALGVTIKDMESRLNNGVRVIRTMPNTPALVNLGASVYTRGSFATIEDGQQVSRLFRSVGEIDEVPEYFLDAVTGLSGSGPAYMYLILEALADGGVKMGLPRELAVKLASQTMMGAAKMVMSTGKSPGQLKDEVCSPGGCTIQGIAALENGAVRASIINAVQQAAEKSIEIAGKN